MQPSAGAAWLDQDLSVPPTCKGRDEVVDSTFRQLVARTRRRTHLERMADHSVIIGERVSYMLTGDPSTLAAEIG